MSPKPTINLNGVLFDGRRSPRSSSPRRRPHRRIPREAKPWLFMGVMAFVLLLWGAVARGQTPTTIPTGIPPVGEFIVFVDDQPSTILIKDATGHDLRIDNFARWRSRGATGLYRSQQDEPLDQWVARGAAAGFKLIPTVPRLADGSVDKVTLARVNANDAVIGWTFEDEADRRQAIKDAAGNPAPQITYPQMQALTAAVRSVATKPVYLTFTGGGGGFDNVYYDGSAAGQRSSGGPGHRAPSGWFGLPDVVVWDYHLWASGRPAMWDIHDRMQDRAWEWSGHKGQLIYIESSPQNLDNKGRPGPNAAQYAELIQRRVDRAKANGQDLRGIIIFPQKIGGGFLFDNTPDDVAAAMPGIHSKLTGKPVPAALPTTQPLPTTAPAVDPALAAVQADLAATRADLATARGEIVTLKASVADLSGTIDRLRAAIQPATRPAGAGN